MDNQDHKLESYRGKKEDPKDHGDMKLMKLETDWEENWEDRTRRKCMTQ